MSAKVTIPCGRHGQPFNAHRKTCTQCQDLWNLCSVGESLRVAGIKAVLDTDLYYRDLTPAARRSLLLPSGGKVGI